MTSFATHRAAYWSPSQTRRVPLKVEPAPRWLRYRLPSFRYCLPSTAAEVDQLATAFDAQTIIVAGDIRALGFLRQHLPTRTRELVRQIDGARADWSLDQITEDTVSYMNTLAAEQLQHHREAFATALGTSKAVQGHDAVFQALRRARVDTLHVVDDTNGPRPTGWTSVDPAHIYAKPDPPDVGPEIAFQQAPLQDIAVRAAVLTGAPIVVIPPGHDGPAEGLGATLRGSRT